jgi:hypothetical protein
LFADPRGFTFEALTNADSVIMGDEVPLRHSPTLLARAPSRGLIRLIHNGKGIKSEWGTEASLRVSEPGAYRVEVRLPRAFGKTRAWIFSNPIYVR